MHLYLQMVAAWEKGADVVLASIVETRGSTYRKTGAELIVDSFGHCLGQLSGGCLEHDIIERSLRLMRTDRSFELLEYLNYSTDDPFADTGSGCRGDMRILLSRTDWLRPYASQLSQALKQKRRLVHATVVNGPDHLLGRRVLLLDGKPLHLDSGLERIADALLTCSHSGLLVDRWTGATLYCQQVPPLRQLLLAGAGSDTVPVARLAASLDYEVHVCDFRPANLIRSRFAPAEVILHQTGRNRDEVEQVIASFSPDTPLVAMSHNLEYDRIFVEAAVNQGMRYIGLLGNQSRLKMVAAAIRPELAARIHCPVGLPLGAETAEEIAFSIVSEVLAYTKTIGKEGDDGI
ncbi:MAG: XdhC family protein [Brevibacillus sp.]|nr:XdhC family protein [Brevibacillus sp.]